MNHRRSPFRPGSTAAAASLTAVALLLGAAAVRAQDPPAPASPLPAQELPAAVDPVDAPVGPSVGEFPEDRATAEQAIVDAASGEVPAPRPPPGASAVAGVAPTTGLGPAAGEATATLTDGAATPATDGAVTPAEPGPVEAGERITIPPRVDPGVTRPPGPDTSAAERPAISLGTDPGDAEPVVITPAGRAPGTGEGDEELLVTLNFKDADVNQVLALYGEFTNRTVIRPAGLTGTVTIRSHTRLTISEALQALDAVLALNNITVFPFGEQFLKVTQLPQAKQESIGLSIGEVPELEDSDRLHTQILQMQHVAVADILAALQPHIRAHGQLQALERTNSILITESESNLKRLLEMVEYLDQPSAVKVEQKVYELKYAEAVEIASKIAELIADSGTGARTSGRVPTPPPPGQRARTPQPTATPGVLSAEFLTEESIVEGRVRITADERTNQLIILSRPVNFTFFDSIIEAFDRKVDPDLQIRVFQLQFAKADELAQLLGQLTGGTVGQSSTRASSRTAGQATSRTQLTRQPTINVIPRPPSTTAAAGSDRLAGQLEGDIRIISDERTNFLIIMADRANIDVLDDLIEELDVEPQQVLIEAIIAEVTLDSSLELGVEWFQRAVTGYTEQNVGGVDVRSPVYSFAGTVNTLPEKPADPRAFFSPEAIPDGISSGLFYYISHFDYNLDVIVRALATSSKFRIRSTPILQTANNQPAHILIGESRPVVTQTQTSFEGGSLRSSYEYRDIGTELNLTPRINREGLVVLDITNKVEDVTSFEVIDGNNVPVISTRETSAQIYMADKSTVVLGGLVSNNKVRTESKVPLLGDIPILGMFFRSEVTDTRRTELIVFITPYVLPTNDAAVQEARRRSELLQQTESLLPWQRGAARQHAAVFAVDQPANAPFPDEVVIPPQEVEEGDAVDDPADSAADHDEDAPDLGGSADADDPGDLDTPADEPGLTDGEAAPADEPARDEGSAPPADSPGVAMEDADRPTHRPTDGAAAPPAGAPGAADVPDPVDVNGGRIIPRGQTR